MAEQYKIAQQEVQQALSKVEYCEKSVAHTLLQCPRCGASYSEEDQFCCECGYKLQQHKCPKCGNNVAEEDELCPICGQNLNINQCPFCGAFYEDSSAFCSECGNPRGGILCPSCNTLNYRNFCRKCNMPLNGLAQQAMKEAAADPRVQQAAQLSAELAELESLIRDASTPFENKENKLSDEDEALMAEYKNLWQTLQQHRGGNDMPPAESVNPQKTAIKVKEKKGISLSFNIKSKEEAITLYKSKLDELRASLQEMVPDAGMTPQMQRDYQSARKLEIETKTHVKIPLFWRCNAYGCEHNRPNECSKPFAGGRWFYKEMDIVTKTTVNP